MPSHGQVSCDLNCQVQCDLRPLNDVEKRAVATRVKYSYNEQGLY
jgi:hypothetical protein